MLQLLLERGMSLKDCLEVLKNSQTGALFTRFKEQISQGEDIQEAMEQILDQRIFESFHFFTQFLSMEKSLKCSLSLISLETSMKKEIGKKCFYPLLMLLLAIVLCLVFNFFLFPIMIGLLENFESETEHLVLIAFCLKILTVFLIVLGFLIGAVVLFCLQKSRIAAVYEFLCSHFKATFLRRLFSYYFICYFLELLCAGCSTQQSIQLMKNVKNQPIIYLYSYRIHELLLRGKSMKEAFQLKGFDPTLVQFIAVGSYSSKMEEVLKNYCELVKKDLEKRLRRITWMIQGLTYGLIGLILIFIYQILLSPMNVITQI